MKAALDIGNNGRVVRAWATLRHSPTRSHVAHLWLSHVGSRGSASQSQDALRFTQVLREHHVRVGTSTSFVESEAALARSTRTVRSIFAARTPTVRASPASSLLTKSNALTLR